MSETSPKKSGGFFAGQIIELDRTHDQRDPESMDGDLRAQNRSPMS